MSFFDSPVIQLAPFNHDRADVQQELQLRTRGLMATYGYRHDQFEELLSQVELKNPPFRIELQAADHMTHGYLFVQCHVPDRGHGFPTTITHQYSIPDPRHRDWLTWIYECVQLAVLHEVAECFHVGGVRVRDPHR